jgi:hypothetical protein
MSRSPLTFQESETAVAYLISLGITAGGVYVVGEAIAADAALPWMIAGLAAVAIGAASFFELFAHVNKS